MLKLKFDRRFLVIIAFSLASCHEKVDDAFKKRKPVGNAVILESNQKKIDNIQEKTTPIQQESTLLAKEELKSSDDEILTIQQIREKVKKQQEMNSQKNAKIQNISEEKQNPNNIILNEQEIDNSKIDDVILNKKNNDIEKKVNIAESTIIQPTLPHSAKNNLFEIQAGVFKNYETANSVMQKFQNLNFAIPRIESYGDMNKVKITSIEAIETEDQAYEFLQKLIDKTQHYDIMIVKVKNPSQI